MFRFLHAADIHLDSAPEGLRSEGPRQVTREAFTKLIDLALAERVDFLLLAGDLYNGDWEDFSTGLFFLQEMRRLGDIPVALIAGNHDACNKMTRDLHLPANVHRFPHDSATTFHLHRHRVAIHGQSFATQAVTDDLSRNYPRPEPGYFNIGLLHTCVAGREGHERYAPCSLEDLRGKGYDYWALGHIHKREVLSEKPHVVFAGNLQGRHIRETGPKGCFLVSVDGNRDVTLDFRGLDVLRWEKVLLDLTGADEAAEVLRRAEAKFKELAQTGPLAFRLHLRGRTSLHRHILGDTERWTHQMHALVGRGLHLEKVRFEIEPIADPFSTTDGAYGELRQVLEDLKNPESLSKFAEEIPELANLSQKLRNGSGEPLPLADALWLQEVLAEVGPLLTDRLFSGGTA